MISTNILPPPLHPLSVNAAFKTSLRRIALCELKTHGRVAGLGAKAKDWRILREIDARVPLDWVTLQGSFTILRHPSELFAFMASLAVRQIGIINSAVFQGGFLVGGKCFDDRVAGSRKHGRQATLFVAKVLCRPLPRSRRLALRTLAYNSLSMHRALSRS